VLIAAGAGGGIAATFNTPVGGVLFAVEIVMIEVSARTLVPVALATATATYVGRLCFGSHPSFVIPALEKPYFELSRPEALLAFVGLGIAAGLVSVVFIRSIYAFEDFFDRVPGGYYVRHAGGMLIVGVLFTVLLHTTGHYHVEGVGYATIQDILGGRLGASLLLVLFAAKLFVTAVTLGSGASGGIFSPGLFLGATLGGAYAAAANALLPGLELHPAAFAVAGMAGVIGGSTGAAMAGIVMIFEMTLDYTVIIPITLTVATSYGVRSLMCAESIYTLKLARRGHGLPRSLRTNLHELRRATDLMQESFVPLPASNTVDETARLLADEPGAAWFLITSAEQVEGVLTRADILAARGEQPRETPLGDVARRDWITVPPGVRLSELVNAMHLSGVSCALVTEGPDPRAPESVRGLITKAEIADALGQLSEIYA
jgi:CIC family chloride channel protein